LDYINNNIYYNSSKDFKIIIFIEVIEINRNSKIYFLLINYNNYKNGVDIYAKLINLQPYIYIYIYIFVGERRKDNKIKLNAAAIFIIILFSSFNIYI
jgi:hypothetical protein